MDNGYRAEQLLVVGAHLRRDAGEHGRRVEGAGPVGHLAAEVNLGALGDGVLDLTRSVRRGRPVRPSARAWCPRSSGRRCCHWPALATNPCRNSSKTEDSTIIRFDDVHTCPALPNLPATAARRRLVDVGAGEHDERVRATEFQHGFLHVPTGEFADGAAGAFGSGQRNTSAARAGDHRRDLIGGGEHVLVDPMRGARRVQQLGQPQRLLRAVARHV